MAEFGIKHITTSLYHPRRKGPVERFNQVLKDNLQLSTVNGLPWKQEIKNLLLAVRTTHIADTKVSPFVLLKGRIPGYKLSRVWMEK